MADPIKNRIVINLDQPGQGRGRAVSDRRSRRWPRVLAVLAAICAVIVLVVAAAAFFWWRHYQTTPAYSLALVIDAAQRDDMPAFRSRLDDEEIARNLMASVREKAVSRYGVTVGSSLQQKIDNLLPTLLPGLKDKIQAEVAKEVKEFSSRAASKPFVVVALAISSLVTITTEGDNARVIAPIPDRSIEVTMRRDGDLWKIVDFKDDVLVQRVAEGVMKDLPASVLDLKIPLLTKPKSRRRNR
jgi:hypothetical protein